VNREQLRAATAKEGIRDTAYSLDGGLPPERYWPDPLRLVHPL